jgi:hypothetical protein
MVLKFRLAENIFTFLQVLSCYRKNVFYAKKYSNAVVEGILGNQAFPEMPRQFHKCLNFPQLPRQFQKNVLIDNVQNLGNGTVSVKNYFKTKLGYPNLTYP